MKKNKNCMTTFSNTLEPISLSLNTLTQSLLSLLRARIFQGVTHWESQWCLQELETHTHTDYTTQIKLWKWEWALVVSTKQGATYSRTIRKKKRWQDWQVKLEKNQNVHGVQPVWLIFVTSNMIHLFHLSPFPLLSSPSCFSTAPSCLTCLQLIIRLAFFLSHAAFLLLLLIFFSIFIFHISCSLSLCSSLMETDRDIEKENLGTIDVQLLLSKSASHLKRKYRSSRRQLEQSDCICLYIVHWTLFI